MLSFFLLNEEFLRKHGESIISRFDAIINPGSDDSFPANESIFSLKNISLQMSIENHYQNMLRLSYINNIPYIGFCSGAQHLSLFHNASLVKLENYDKGNKQIKLKFGTLTYFFNLPNKLKESFLLNCTKYNIEYSGQVAHHFAALASSFDGELEVGAVSQDNVPMIIAHKNGIRYGVQFHPENYYAREEENSLKQRPFLESFITLAIMHHNHRIYGGIHPIELAAEIKEKIEDCLLL